jgi:hypothetical protein
MTEQEFQEVAAEIAALPTVATRYLTCAETAKLVRTALKGAFPGEKFSVRSSTYAGGASIDVSWTDGPTVRDVDRVVQPFAGADFDGMQDLKTYRGAQPLDGEKVSFGADFVQTHRRISDERRATYEQVVAEQTGRPYEPNGDYRNDCVMFQGRHARGTWGSDLIYSMSGMVPAPQELLDELAAAREQATAEYHATGTTSDETRERLNRAYDACEALDR